MKAKTVFMGMALALLLAGGNMAAGETPARAEAPSPDASPAPAENPAAEAAAPASETPPAEKTGLPLPENLQNAERLEGRGEMLGARIEYQAALEKMLSGPEPLTDAELAVAEFLLCRISALSVKLGENRDPGFHGIFMLAAKTANSSPFFRMLAKRAEMENQVRNGGRPERLLKELGILTAYAVVGPFANERGRAFNEDMLASPLESKTRARAAAENTLPDFTAVYRGKKHPVSWRRETTPDPLGTLDFTYLCQPDQEALAYAAVFVECAGETEAALRLAADDTLKVWINGSLCLSREGEHDAVFAQENIPCRFRPGVNLLLFKVGQAADKWSLTAALTDPEGGALTGVREVTDEVLEGKIKPALPAAARADFPVAGGAIPFLREHLKANPADARALYMLTRIQAARGVKDRNSQELRQQLMLAMRLEPRNAVYPLALAEIADESGRFKADRDDNLRRLSLLRVLQREPGNVAALTALGEHYLHAMQSPRRAREYAEKAVAQNRFAAGANILLAEIYRAHGWDARAQKLLTELSQRHPQHPGVLRALAECQRANGQSAAALKTYRAIIRNDAADADAVRAAAEILCAAGRPDEAAEVWNIYRQLHPRDRGACLAGIECAIAALPPAAPRKTGQAVLCNDASGGLLINEFLFDPLPQCAEFQVLRARLHLARGETAAAEKAFAAALKLDPGQTAARAYLQYRGHPLPEMFTPQPDLAEFAARAEADEKTKELAAGADRVIYLQEQVDELNGDGTKRRGMHTVFRVLTRAGADKFRRLPVWYAPETEEAAFVTARVLHRDGSVSEAQIVPVRRPGDRQVRMAVFPALNPGDTVETSYVVTQTAPDFFGEYFGHVHCFRRKEPVAVSRYILRAPAGKALYFHLTGGAPAARERARADGGRERVWEMNYLPALADEPFALPPEERTPAVQVSTFKTWEELGRWYWGLVKSQNVLTPEIKEKVAELTEGLETAEDKAGAIFDWVATEVRNNAWSFGVHGFKPYNAGAIFTRRFGDCKDKATLINVMARAAGLEAWPVLVRATGWENGRGREDLSLPMLNHFNHCISLVMLDGKPQFLDGTMHNRTLSALPFTDVGARAVVVRPSGGELVSTPEYRPDDNVWKENASLALEDGGTADYAFNLTGRGQTSVLLRGWFDNDQTWDQVLRSLGREHYGPVSAAVVDSVQIRQIEDELPPDETRLNGRLRLREYGRVSGREMTVRVPAPLLNGKFGYDGALPARMADYALYSQRETPLALPALFAAERVIRVEFPEDWELLDTLIPENLEFPFGSLRAEISGRGNIVEIRTAVTLKQTRVEPADYAAFRRFCLAADRLNALDLHFRLPAGKK